MNRITQTFKQLRAKQEKALIPFITAGDPDLATTAALIPLLATAGADIIELGMPFSDPMADGPTIQQSSERALAAGTTLAGILAAVKSARQSTQVPIVLMGYFNPVLQFGLDQFAAAAADAGVDGVLIVDLPLEEATEFRRACRRHGLDLIFLITPTTDPARIARIAAQGQGYLYYVSVAGVTGARASVAAELEQRVTDVKSHTELPVVVGFGIATPEQAAAAGLAADGVVVGSALVKLFEGQGAESLRQSVTGFVQQLKSALCSRPS
jgi:tryptophan synthase alpha chain